MTGRELSASGAVEILKEMVSGGDAGLEGGAELEVFDDSGRSVFLAPLARHVRRDENGTIWVRPIVGGSQPHAGAHAYVSDSNVARRRALDPLEIQRDGSEVVFRLRSGERACVRPVTRGTKPVLEMWDSHYYGALSAGEQLDLDALQDDS